MKIPFEKLAQYKHIKFIIKLEKQANLAYRYIMESMKDEIIAELKKDRLVKSELPKGWTGEVPKIEVDVGKRIESVLTRHFSALRWVLFGKSAGRKAEEAAKSLKLEDKVIPGTLNAAYLQSLDSHREHYQDILEKVAPEMSKRLISLTMKNINTKSDVFFRAFLEQTRMQILAAINKLQDSVNYKNISQVLEDSHDNLHDSETPGEAVEKAIEGIDSRIGKRGLVTELNSAIEKQEYAWDKLSQSQINMASSVGTHQSFAQLYGSEDSSMRLVNIPTYDERTCDFCNKISKNPDGSWKYYKLSELMPNSYNYGRKRVEWRISLGIQHVNCRCIQLYCPAGFEVDPNGSIRKKK